MKYSELERLLKKAGCYDTGETEAGHPLWINPKTRARFPVSHHHSQEVAAGTLKKHFESGRNQMSTNLKNYKEYNYEKSKCNN